VFQFLRNRGDLPALTVFERFSRSAHAVLAEAELTATDRSGTQSEFDFAVLEGGDLWLGEAFTADRYEPTKKRERERLERLREIAEVLNARGVILATAADALSERTRDQAQRVVPGPWPRLELRERAWTLRRPARLIDEGR
jgi:hypothetical protein